MPTIFPPTLAVLEFSSLSMLGWLAAAVLPWWIHRWNRRRRQTTSWAAVELLLTAVRQQSRRVYFQQWLLIIVRTAILVMVVLAASEPVLRQWAGSASGTIRTHLILVIDQSYSMGCEQQGFSRLQRAKTQARRQIENRRSGDAFSILGWAQSAEDVIGRPTFDSSLALSAVDDLRPSQATASLPTALRAVSKAIERAEREAPDLSQHQVVFLTDLGRSTWALGNMDVEEWQSLSESLAKRASLVVLDVGDDQRDNVAVTDLKVEPTIVLRQRNVDLVATLCGFGKRDWPELTATLAVDGRRVDQQQIDLPSGGETELRFSYRFVDEGSHTVEVAITDDPDCLALDDRRWLVVNVRPRLRVACLAGQPGAADDVARALAPSKNFLSPDRGSSHEAIEPKILPASRLAEMDLSHFDAVLLCNVAELSPREAALVTQYVRNGGGLAILLGDAVIADRYNYAFLPTRIGPLALEGDYHFDPLGYRHPIVMPFRGRETSGLLGVTIARYFRLEPGDQHPLAETALAFDTGDPAIVVDRFGLGRVAVMATPGSLATRSPKGVPWSSFAVSPSFLPIVREMTAYLVGDRWLEQRNLLVGQPIVFRERASFRQAPEMGVRLPDGGRWALPSIGAEDRGKVVFSETNASGVYSLDAASDELARFAVNLDTRESDLATVNVATFPAGFRAVGVEPSMESLTTKADFSLVRSLLAGTLALLFLEQFLAWQQGRGWG